MNLEEFLSQNIRDIKLINEQYELRSIIHENRNENKIVYFAKDLKLSTREDPVFRAIKITQFQFSEDKESKNNTFYELLRMFLYINKMKSLSHDNYIQYYDIFMKEVNKQDNIYEIYIVMDYCKYKSLDKYFEGKLTFYDHVKKFLIADITNGLYATYEILKVNHFTLCPENILLDKYAGSIYPRAKLLEVAKVNPIDGFVGTIDFDYNQYFQPPEYSNKQYHSKSEVWSFGMLIYYIK